MGGDHRRLAGRAGPDRLNRIPEEEDVYEHIKKILMTSFNVAEEDFVEGATLDDLGLDSLDLVELSMQLETLGARVTDDEMVEAGRLDAVVALLESRLATTG